MFKFEDNKCYRMPAHFGGWVFDPDAQAIYHDVVSLAYPTVQTETGSPTIFRKAST